MIDSSNGETNFYHKLLLKNRQVPNIPKAFAKNSATSAVPALANMKLLNSQISKITQENGFPDRLLGPLIQVGLAFIKNVSPSSGKSVLVPLRLTSAASTTGTGIHKIILIQDQQHFFFYNIIGQDQKQIKNILHRDNQKRDKKI